MTLVSIIVGASRGIGKEIAHQIAQKYPKSHLILTSSNSSIDLLLNVQKSITCSSSIYNFDFENPSVEFLKDVKLLTATEILFFCNAGTLGKLERFHALSSHDIEPFMNINVTVPMMQCHTLLNLYPNIPTKIINTSSLAALQPFDCWSLYCTSKAARDMFFKCLAHEFDIEKSPNRVLNYAPGPCDTRLKDQILNMPETTLRQTMKGIEWIPTVQTVEKLLNLLEKNEFVNGQHIDFYDV